MENFYPVCRDLGCRNRDLGLGQFETETNGTWQTYSSTGHTLTVTIKFCYHGNSPFSSPHQSVFNILVIFKNENETRPRHLPNPFICLPDHAYEAPLPNIKMESQNWPEKLLASCCHGKKIVKVILWNTTSRE